MDISLSYVLTPNVLLMKLRGGRMATKLGEHCLPSCYTSMLIQIIDSQNRVWGTMGVLHRLPVGSQPNGGYLTLEFIGLSEESKYETLDIQYIVE